MIDDNDWTQIEHRRQTQRRKNGNRNVCNSDAIYHMIEHKLHTTKGKTNKKQEQEKKNDANQLFVKSAI